MKRRYSCCILKNEEGDWRVAGEEGRSISGRRAVCVKVEGITTDSTAARPTVRSRSGVVRGRAPGIQKQAGLSHSRESLKVFSSLGTQLDNCMKKESWYKV